MQPISEGNLYRTDPNRRRGVFSRLFTSHPATFYPQMILVVARARRKALGGSWTDADWYRSSLDTVDVFENVGMDIEISGLDHLRGIRGPVVIVSNHMSTLETFAFPGLLLPFTRLTFVVKDSLVAHPFFGPVMRTCDPIVVGRKNPREDLVTVLNEGTRVLKEGKSLVIFPQSTRSHIFRPASFNSLGIKLALRAGVPIIPCALRTDAWGSGKKLKDFGPVRPALPVRICFGPSLEVRGKGADEHRQVMDFILQHLRQWGVTVEEEGDQTPGPASDTA